MLLLRVTVLVCGAGSAEGIHFFGETRLSWLKQYLALPNGIPCTGTILFPKITVSI
jgi:hypothetical protein